MKMIIQGALMQHNLYSYNCHHHVLFMSDRRFIVRLLYGNGGQALGGSTTNTTFNQKIQALPERLSATDKLAAP